MRDFWFVSTMGLVLVALMLLIFGVPGFGPIADQDTFVYALGGIWIIGVASGAVALRADAKNRGDW